MVSLALHRPEPKPVESLDRLATRVVLVSTPAIARVNRFDGHTRVVAVRTAAGWQRSARLRWSRATVDRLRGEVREVVLARGFRRVRLPMSWMPPETRS